MKSCKNLKGGLQEVAEQLEVFIDACRYLWGLRRYICGCVLLHIFFSITMYIPTQLVDDILESPCLSLIHQSEFRVITSAPNEWIKFKFGGLGIHCKQFWVLSDINFCFMGHSHFSHYGMKPKDFITKILASCEWIAYKFDVWLYIVWIYSVSYFGCHQISTSCTSGGIPSATVSSTSWIDLIGKSRKGHSLFHHLTLFLFS